jgi:exosome complex component RRP43
MDENAEDVVDDSEDSEIKAFNLLVPNVSLNTGCSPSIPAGTAPTPLAQSLSHQILSLLHTSHLVRAEDLRIWHQPPKLSEEQDVAMAEDGNDDVEDSSPEPEIKAFWTLYIDVLIISLAGNPFDAAWAAVVAALRDTKLPRAWWDMDNEMVLCSDNVSEAKSLSLRGLPMSSSFCVFEADAVGDWKRLLVSAEGTEKQKGKQKQISTEEQSLKSRRWILADPDAFEESLCQERACVVVDVGVQGQVKVLKLEKNGGFYVGKEEMKELVGLAAERWGEWKPLLEGSK